MLATESLGSVRNLEVTAHNGTVTVAGDADNHRDIDKVLSTVLMVEGVKDVRSVMTIKGKRYPEEAR